jgi:hypothetical protein
VEQNIHNVNILLTCAYNRNDAETSTLRLHWGRCSTRTGPKYVGSLVCTESLGLRSHSRSHRGCCSTKTGPKYVGSSVCTESLRMYVGYTNSFSIRFFVNTYNTVHIILIKIHIVFTIAYNTYWAFGRFFSQKNVARGWSVTPFFGAKCSLPPPPKKNLPQQRSPYRLVCTTL